jgi:ankyrin repeat protein
VLRAWTIACVLGLGCREPVRPQQPATTTLAGSATPDGGVSTGVDAKDSEGWTALQHAAMSGHVEDIERLLADGASLESSSPKVYDGANAFVIALHFGEHDAAKLLLDRGSSIAGTLGSTALALAARDGDDEILDVLLARGVSPTGSHALHLAAEFGRASAITKLLKAGAPVDERKPDDHGFTPLVEACSANQLESARLLIAAGAKPNQRDDDGTTVLHWAVFGARDSEVHIYSKPGAPHDTVFIPQKVAPVVQLLLDKGARINEVDREGNTALHEAAMIGAEAAAGVLVRAGASRKLKNLEGKTAYDLAHDRHNSVEAIVKP